MPWNTAGEYIVDATSNQDNAGNDAFTGNADADTTLSSYFTPGAGTGALPPTDWLGTINSTLGTAITAADLAKFGIGAGALAGIAGLNNPNVTKVGYQGKIPELQASRAMVTAPPPGRRPGSGGINWGGDVTYSPKGTAGGIATPTPTATAPSAVIPPVAATPPAVMASLGLPGNWDTLDAAQKIAQLNTMGITPDKLVALGIPTGDIDWMKTQGYTGGVAPVVSRAPVTPTAVPVKPTVTPAPVNATMVSTPTPPLSSVRDLYTQILGREPDAAGLAYWQSQFGNGAITSEQQKQFLETAQNVLANTPESERAALAPKLVNKEAPVTPAAVAAPADLLSSLPAGWGVQGGDYDTAKEKIDYFNAAGITPAQLLAAGTSPEDIAWMKSEGGYKVNAAQGGLMKLARGGSTGHYLQGDTDGMADEIATSIDGNQPAALSHGEFVVPADVVSHLGNGNSDAGAKKLYSMMDKIREARTGNKKQGKRINPDKFMPGGLAGYAAGGTVQKFAGETGSAVGSVASGVTGVEQTPSSWAGDYVTNMLGQGQALANAPYQQYMGPLTAGASTLQNQAFQTAGGLTTPASIGTAATTAGDIATKAQGLSYTPTTSNFGTDQAQQYMNPYLQQSLEPQLAEARRQSEITAQQNAGAMTKAGAFGGGRQAILTAENQRNLGTNLADITGKGYNTAYTNAMQQFNADQARKAQENQFGATYGLEGLKTGLQGAQTQGGLGVQENQMGLANLAQQSALGTTQRGIESEGIAADKAAFEAARQAPYTNLQFQQSLLSGLPITAQNYQLSQPSALTSAAAGAVTTNKLLETLGLLPKTPQ